MDSRLTLDALGDVVRELYAVEAERAGRSRSVDGGTAVAAEDPVGVRGGVSLVFCEGNLRRARCRLLRRLNGHRSIINIHRHLDDLS